MNQENGAKSNSEENVNETLQRDASFGEIGSVCHSFPDENLAKPDGKKGDVEDTPVDSVEVNEKVTASKDIWKDGCENNSNQVKQETKCMSANVEKNKNSDQEENFALKTENVDKYTGKNRKDVNGQVGSTVDKEEVSTEFRDDEDHKESSVDETVRMDSKDGEDQEGNSVDEKENIVVSSKDNKSVETATDVNKNGGNESTDNDAHDDVKIQHDSLKGMEKVEEDEKEISRKMVDGVKEDEVEVTPTRVGVESSGKIAVEKMVVDSNDVSNNKVEESEYTPDVVENTGEISSEKDENNHEEKGLKSEGTLEYSLLASHMGDFQNSENHGEIRSENIDDDLPIATDDVDGKIDKGSLVVVGVPENGPEKDQPAEMPVALATEEIAAKLPEENALKTSKEQPLNVTQATTREELPEEDVLAEGSTKLSEAPVKLALTAMEEMPLSTTETKSEKADNNEQLSSEFSIEQAKEGFSKNLNADTKQNGSKENEEARIDSSSSGTVDSVQVDDLTRQGIASQEKEIYLEEKLAETTRELEMAERKVKDLQLRLKRFVKDDEAKDCKIRQMEREYKELAEQMHKIEEALVSKNSNIEVEPTEPKKSSSHVCVIL